VVAGDSVLVRVRLTDNTGVRRVGVQGYAIYGDPELGTEDPVLRFETRSGDTEFEGLPADTTVSRYLIYDPASAEIRPPEVAVETLSIQVTATDVGGTSSTASRLMQLRHDVNPPQVTILDFQADQVVDPAAIDTVRVRVSDVQGQVRTGVRFVTLEAQQITGSALDGSLSVQTLAGPLDFFPQEPPIVEAQTLSGVLGPISESDAPRGAYFLIATARDTIGNVAADTLRLFRDPPPAGAPGSGTVGAGVAPAGVGGYQAVVQTWEGEVTQPWEGEVTQPWKGEVTQPWKGEVTQPWEGEPTQPWAQDAGLAWAGENGRAQRHRLVDRAPSEIRVRRERVSGLHLPQ
jgi:hypothetical protein